MNSVDQAKSMDRKLRSALAKGDTDISHSEALELVANMWDIQIETQLTPN